VIDEVLPEPRREILDEPVAFLDLKVRIINELERNDILTVFELLHCCARPPQNCSCSRKHLLAFSNFGQKTVEEIFEKLAIYGFYRVGDKRRADSQ
jgi:DNA-directed RNA polymerase alpha subunit